MPAIGEAWFDLTVPVDKLTADLQRAEQTARAQTAKIQQSITKTMKGVDWTPNLSGMKRMEDTVSADLQRMLSQAEQTAAKVSGADVTGTRRDSIFRRMPGVGVFGEAGAVAGGVIALTMAARAAATALEAADDETIKFIKANGRMPEATQYWQNFNDAAIKAIPIVGQISEAFDKMSNKIYGVSALEALSQYNQDQTKKVVDARQKFTELEHKFDVETQKIFTGPSTREKIDAQEEYNATLKQARDALKDLDEAERARRLGPVEAMAAKRRDQRLYAADLMDLDVVRGFNQSGDPMQKELDSLQAGFEKAYEAVKGNLDAQAELGQEFQRRQGEITQKYHDKQLNENMDFLTGLLAQDEKWLQRTGEIDRKVWEQKARRAHDAGQLSASIMGGERGKLAGQLQGIEEKYGELSGQYRNEPKMQALIERAREAELVGAERDYEQSQQSERRRISRGTPMGNYADLSPAMRRRMYQTNPDRLYAMDEAGRQEIIGAKMKKELDPVETMRLLREAKAALDGIRAALTTN